MECTFVIFDEPIQQVYQKKELTNVEIQEQTTSLVLFSDSFTGHFCNKMRCMIKTLSAYKFSCILSKDLKYTR